MSANAERFARIVRERREQLDRTQLDVWQAKGPSNTTLTKIENGLLESLSRTTAKKLDTGLRWMEGSAKRAWGGGEPTSLPDETDAVAAAIMADESITAREKRRLLAAVNEARSQGQGDDDGESAETA